MGTLGAELGIPEFEVYQAIETEVQAEGELLLLDQSSSKDSLMEWSESDASERQQAFLPAVGTQPVFEKSVPDVGVAAAWNQPRMVGRREGIRPGAGRGACSRGVLTHPLLVSVRSPANPHPS